MQLYQFKTVLMLRKVTAMTVRQKLGELLNEVQYRDDRVVITKAGKPVAALVDVDLYERITRLDQEFDEMAGELASAFEALPEDQVVELVHEALKAARRDP